jgi:hypothetical protein
VSRFDITRRLRAAVDRSEDPHLLIDMVREEQEEHLQRLKALEREVRGLKVSLQSVREWTATGVWNAVKVRLDSQALKAGKKLAWGIVAGGGTLLLGLITWLASHLTWKAT